MGLKINEIDGNYVKYLSQFQNHIYYHAASIFIVPFNLANTGLSYITR